jgi:hypothetical protein
MLKGSGWMVLARSGRKGLEGKGVGEKGARLKRGKGWIL